MDFEWDETKRRVNLDKHGIDFVRARQVFDGRPSHNYPSSFAHEARHITIAELNGQLVAVVWTWRAEETIRIISARRARHGEGRTYRALHG